MFNVVLFFGAIIHNNSNLPMPYPTILYLWGGYAKLLECIEKKSITAAVKNVEFFKPLYNRYTNVF
jgi:hypothetical protein